MQFSRVDKGPSEVSYRMLRIKVLEHIIMMKVCWMPSPPLHLCYISTMAELEDAMGEGK